MMIPPEQNALAHFLTHRRSQAFSPTPLFDVGWYVEQHTEELTGNRDPFAQFLQAGTFRDIDPSPGFQCGGVPQATSRPAEPAVPPPDASGQGQSAGASSAGALIAEAGAKSGVSARAHGAYLA